MRKEINLKKDNAVSELFKWRDRQGNFHPIDQMETSHLFNTIVMIWNHTLPAEAATHDYIRYVFTPFYTKKYLIDGITAMFPELTKRKLTQGQKEVLNRMRHYFDNVFNQELLKETPKQLEKSQ